MKTGVKSFLVFFIAPALCWGGLIPQSQGSIVSRDKELPKCEKAMIKFSKKFTAKKLSELGGCAVKAYSCTYKPLGRKTSCLASARRRCRRAINSISKQRAKFGKAILKKCKGVDIEDIFGFAGMGFDGTKEVCLNQYGVNPATLSEIISCLQKNHDCLANKIISMSLPRTKEMLSRTGVNVAQSACLINVEVPPVEPWIRITYVPPYGKKGIMKGYAGDVDPTTTVVACYIEVGGGWWTKPYFNQPTVKILKTGRWSCDIATGGVDELATTVAAFLWPKNITPPKMSGHTALPSALFSTALDYEIKSRNP